VNDQLFLAGAGLLAGVLNAVGGGGSFVSFPALIYAGVPSVAANATNTVALFPGALASAYALRRVFRRLDGVPTAQVVGLSLIGAVFGAVLLLTTPSSVFDKLVPWLLLVGALTFAFGVPLGVRLRRVLRIGLGLGHDQNIERALRCLAIIAGIDDRAVGETHRNRKGMVAIGLGPQAERALRQVEAANGKGCKRIGECKLATGGVGPREQDRFAEREMERQLAIGGGGPERRKRQDGQKMDCDGAEQGRQDPRNQTDGAIGQGQAKGSGEAGPVREERAHEQHPRTMDGRAISA
jgi:hypothetical protein